MKIKEAKNKLVETFGNADAARRWLEEIYVKQRSRGVMLRLRDLGIDLSEESARILIKEFGVPLLPPNEKQSLVIQILGGEKNCREILSRLSSMYGASKIANILRGEFINDEIRSILRRYGVNPEKLNLEVSKHVIISLLKRFGILQSKRQKAGIEKLIRVLGGVREARNILENIYWGTVVEKNGKPYYLSLKHSYELLLKKYPILRALGVSFRTFKEAMKFLGIRLRSYGERIPKKPFQGSKLEKLYMWGLCYGDALVLDRQSYILLEVEGKFDTIMCFTKCFSKYHLLCEYILCGKLKLKRTKGGRYNKLSISLDKSFSFLLDDYVKVLNSIENMDELASLLAGLVDSDGSVCWHDPCECVAIAITSTDYNFLEKLSSTLQKFGFSSGLYRSMRKGAKIFRKYVLKRDAWKLRILGNSEKNLQLIKLVSNYVNHKERKEKLMSLLNR
ncbi:MAG: LAGLIDADG family homing endonuclease [Candidatus Njordarchaeales archaeon]